MSLRDYSIFEKTLGLNDFYWGEEDYPYPMGNIQTTGKVMPEMLAAALKQPIIGTYVILTKFNGGLI